MASNSVQPRYLSVTIHKPECPLGPQVPGGRPVHVNLSLLDDLGVQSHRLFLGDPNAKRIPYIT